jgi:hypothetical protein
MQTRHALSSQNMAPDPAVRIYIFPVFISSEFIPIPAIYISLFFFHINDYVENLRLFLRLRAQMWRIGRPSNRYFEKHIDFR